MNKAPGPFNEIRAKCLIWHYWLWWQYWAIWSCRRKPECLEETYAVKRCRPLHQVRRSVFNSRSEPDLRGDRRWSYPCYHCATLTAFDCFREAEEPEAKLNVIHPSPHENATISWLTLNPIEHHSYIYGLLPLPYTPSFILIMLIGHACTFEGHMQLSDLHW